MLNRYEPKGNVWERFNVTKHIAFNAFQFNKKTCFVKSSARADHVTGAKVNAIASDASDFLLVAISVFDIITSTLA